MIYNKCLYLGHPLSHSGLTELICTHALWIPGLDPPSIGLAPEYLLPVIPEENKMEPRLLVCLAMPKFDSTNCITIESPNPPKDIMENIVKAGFYNKMPIVMTLFFNDGKSYVRLYFDTQEDADTIQRII